MRLPTVLSEQTIARSRFFTVQSRDLEFSNGEKRTYERLLPGAREAVIVVACNDQGQVLLIREYAAGFHENQLTLPKGAVDPGETIEAAASRELAEEVGFAARKTEFVKKLSLAPGHMGFTINVVFATDLYPKTLPGDEPEPPEVVPWNINDLPALVESDQFNEARAIAALTLCSKHMSR